MPCKQYYFTTNKVICLFLKQTFVLRKGLFLSLRFPHMSCQFSSRVTMGHLAASVVNLEWPVGLEGQPCLCMFAIFHSFLFQKVNMSMLHKIFRAENIVVF